MASVRFEDWAASRSNPRPDPAPAAATRAPLTMADLQPTPKHVKFNQHSSSYSNVSSTSTKLNSELKELEQRLEESRLRSLQRQQELNDQRHDRTHDLTSATPSRLATSASESTNYSSKTVKTTTDHSLSDDSDDSVSEHAVIPPSSSRKKHTETITTTYSHGPPNPNSLDEVESLRQRLMEKTREIDRVRSELDRALQQLREKETQYQHSELLSSKRANESKQTASKYETIAQENASLRAKLSERDDVIETMKKSMAHMDSRLLALHRDLENAERIIDEARADSDKLEHDLDFKLSILEQSKFALSNELEAMATEMRDKNSEIVRLLFKTKEQEEQVGQARAEIQGKTDDLNYKLQEIDRWEAEVTKLRRELDDERHRSASLMESYEAFKAGARSQLHQLQSELSAAEIERNTISSVKVELVHDVNRLNRQLAERENQIQKLNRVLEQKEQEIAELTPLAKELKRTSRMTTTESFTASTPSKRWK